MVVFERGIVKVGRSNRSADIRISTHINYALAFEISVAAIFKAEILVNDTKSWEERIIAKISRFAKNKRGKEWFQFDSTENALAFASSHFYDVVQMNLNGVLINHEKPESKNQPYKISEQVSPILAHSLSCEGGCIYSLAYTLKVSPNTVSRWLSSSPPVRKAIEMVKIYGRKKPKKSNKWNPS